jgi:DNA modification methylase
LNGEKVTIKAQIEYLNVNTLKPYGRNARTHSKRQIRQIAESIRRFGFVNPVLISAELEIVAGHGRVEAAKLVGMPEVPAVRLSHLSAAERRAYVLADNQLALKAGWDREILAIELQFLVDEGFELQTTGFEIAEVDAILDEASDKKASTGPEDALPPLSDGAAVSRTGDLWIMGGHRLLCGDARDPAAYADLLGNDQAEVVVSDPPYNVPIDGHVGGLGRIKHREFAMASGEMSEAEFTTFLTTVLERMADRVRDGAILFVFMDWKHAYELMTAGRALGLELKNLCVWAKDNAGMGTFYRSKHELVFVFKKGKAAHLNNFELGQHGRYRTNLWEYAGVNTLRPGRMDELAMHPTVKPVALVADALRDCSRRNGLVLDAFCGSGTTVIAAEKVGRRARVLEIDPGYVDVAVRRWQAFTGKAATLAGSKLTFEEVQAERAGAPATAVA